MTLKEYVINAVVSGFVALMVVLAAPVGPSTKSTFPFEAYNTSYNIENFCSATAIDKKNLLLVTANHCINKESKDGKIPVYRVWHGNIAFDTVVLKQDKEHDIAILKVIGVTQEEAKDFWAADLGLNYELGQQVYCVGNSFGMFDSTVTEGVLSALNRKIPWVKNTDNFQMSCQIAPGNSGGGLFNADGQLIGVNVAAIPQWTGFGWAIPAKYILDLLGEINENE